MAAFRALESVRPARERLFQDPYAERFLSRSERLLVACSRTAPLRRLVELYADLRAPGALTSGVARTRLIDDWVVKAVEDGVRQVVVLGAGFDCRALRLPSLAGISVFEIDRPELIAYKSDLLAGESRTRPSLKRVAMNFLEDNLTDRLLGAGYARGVRTLFVWEGVTNYLDAESVAGVFDFVAGHAPPGSRIAFTYVHADAVTGLFDAPGLQALLKALHDRGEPWTFGLEPQELPAYLAAHGLELLADLGATEYRRRYPHTRSAGTVGYEFYHAALAETMAPTVPR